MQYLIKLLCQTVTKAILLISLFYLYSLLQAHVLHVDEDRRFFSDLSFGNYVILFFISFVTSFVQIEKQGRDQNFSSHGNDRKSDVIQADQNGIPS
ncbi:hypothetical protein [Rhodopirellula baltica]|uniref:Uncharacterized protein n=1 Tax=Rhodopirellula baltica (strain DSM 10527 / NCIMB 13988 / SH1) TaxID=243090 RepID=Q7UGF0_RHOBA|nr:hypothetical protein [Rhodopirellula baltica]CAD78379.1 hypothetical protein-transmembrane prediction [Rhodopirellula baltica SH 1]